MLLLKAFNSSGTRVHIYNWACMFSGHRAHRGKKVQNLMLNNRGRKDVTQSYWMTLIQMWLLSDFDFKSQRNANNHHFLC